MVVVQVVGGTDVVILVLFRWQVVGLDRLKAELQARGLKCGGTLTERGARLFLLTHTPLEKIDAKHVAKPAHGGKKNKK